MSFNGGLSRVMYPSIFRLNTAKCRECDWYNLPHDGRIRDKPDKCSCPKKRWRHKKMIKNLHKKYCSYEWEQIECKEFEPLDLDKL